MYLSYYNLEVKPFQISTDPKFLWMGEKHKEALAILKYGIMDSRGFLLLTGDVGTGKTTLINALINSLGNKNIIAIVPDPGLEKIDFFNFIAAAFNINETFVHKSDFLIRLTGFLHTAYAENKKTLLIIDEAQRLNHELLEEIRLLSNIEKQNVKLINIFFVGQNEFNDTLLETKNRALRQRITINYNIEPLTEEETKEYIRHRLQIAGSGKNLFSSGAMREIFSFSDGYPRLINIICDHGLLSGYVKEKKIINAEIIKECAKELKIQTKAEKTVKIRREEIKRISPASATQSPPKTFKKFAGYMTALLLLLMTTGYLYYAVNMKHFFDRIPGYFKNTQPVHSINKTSGKKGNIVYKKVTQPNGYRGGKKSVPTKKHEISTDETEKPIDNELPSKKNKPVPFVQDKTKVFGNATEKTINQVDSERKNGLQLISNQSLIIYYDYNSSELSDKAIELLDRLAATMNHNPDIKIDIRGYTDQSGRYLYNKMLSEFRANNVKSYLSGKGVDPSKMTAFGMVSGDTVFADDSKNRRVEIDW